jgi:uncharacterized protein (DUF1697 family)
MTHAIALLRAVNVGGTGKLTMAELAKLLTKLGYTGVKTLLQSGNVVFACMEKGDAKLEATIETAIAKAFGITTAVYVRTAAEWDAMIAANPFPDAAKSDPSRFHVMAFKSAPSAANVKALQAAIAGNETVHAVGKHLYMIYPDGMGNSKLTNAVIDRKLGLTGTARNWNTVLKLAAAVPRQARDD